MVDSDVDGLHVNLRGEADEKVALLYVRVSDGLMVQRAEVVIGANGRALANISASD
jgi:hypothetical protein